MFFSEILVKFNQSPSLCIAIVTEGNICVGLLAQLVRATDS